MKPAEQIPYYAPDGTSLGFRSMEAAKRLIAGGFVKPSYGRKGHLKAIWLRREDGSSPVETHARAGTRYSFVENLEHGRCWKLRRLVRKPILRAGDLRRLGQRQRTGTNEGSEETAHDLPAKIS